MVNSKEMSADLSTVFRLAKLDEFKDITYFKKQVMGRPTLGFNACKNN